MRVPRIRARLASILAVALVAASAITVASDDVTQVFPQSPAPVADATGGDETAQNWFVELNTAPTSEGSSTAAVQASKDAFRAAARSKGTAYTERFSYGDLWNGLSVSATPSAIAAIRGLAGVKAIWPVVTERLPQATSGTDDTIDLSTAIQMTGADYVQDTLGFTGKNVKVAIMDTGVDYDHPDLGGCFGPACRVFTGWDFVGDAYNADPSSVLYNPTATPDADPDDCNGHGTHVAGIVGASGTAKGVAPDARFGAYRVFGCNGSTTADIMLAAMERALADKMDVLNMSIGSAFQWPQYPTAVAADRLVTKHGIVVVASIGNSGASGIYSAGAPGVGANVIGVASFDNSHVTLRTFTLSPDGAAVGYLQATGAPAAPTTGAMPLARTGTTTTGDDACSPLPAGSLSGKVALIRRGTCTFHIKSLNAQNAGAIGVVLYNNSAGFFSPTVAGVPAITIPVVATSNTLGALIDGRIAAGPTTMTWTSAVGSFPSPTAGLASSFSSYGVAPDLTLKPDIGAPGGNIYSTLPLEQGGYGVLSGTSMSSPHVAGAAALLLQARSNNLQNLDPAGVRAILQNSADPRPFFGSPSFVENVHRQGAGMLDIRGAIQAKTVLTPSKLSLGESQSGPATRTLTIRSLPGAGKTVTYTFSHQPALSTGPNTFTPAFFTGYATVAFSAPSVTVKNNQSASVAVTITANPGLADRSQYGGFIVATGDDGSVFRIPYSGFKGDYQSIPVLTGLRAAARQTGYVNSGGAIAASYNTGLTGYTFTMGPKPNPGGFGYATFMDVPNYLVHFDHQTRQATWDAYDATGTTLLGQAMTVEYLGRNSTSTAFFAFAWDGEVGPAGSRTTLPNGEYVLKLTVLKALGDPSTAGHTETFTFGKVNIQRP